MFIKIHSDSGQIQSITVDKMNSHKVLVHLERIFDKAEAKSITNIHLKRSLLNHLDYQALENIIQRSHELRHLSLRSNHIDTDHSFNIFNAISSLKIDTIDFTDNWIGENVDKSYFKFLNNLSGITSLDFSLNWLRDKGIMTLVNALNPNLKKLNLCCNDFSTEGVMGIYEYVKESSELKEIDISYNNLGSDASVYIANIIKECPSLEVINLNSNQLQDNGLLRIIDALKIRKEYLNIDLSDNGLSRQGMKTVFEILSQAQGPKKIKMKKRILEEDIKEISVSINELKKNDIEMIVEN